MRITTGTYRWIQTHETLLRSSVAPRLDPAARNAAMNSMGARMPMSFTPMQAGIQKSTIGFKFICCGFHSHCTVS